mgnify:CR=1 FL=1
MSKKTVKIIALIIAALLILGIAGPFAYLVFSMPLDESDLNSGISIDEQIRITDRINELEANIKESEKNVKELKAKLEAAESLENEYIKESGRRFRTMCEKGDTSYLEIIFSAKNIEDLTDRIVTARELADYDKKIMEALKSVKEKISAAETESENALTELQKNKAELAAAKAELDSQKAARQRRRGGQTAK